MYACMYVMVTITLLKFIQEKISLMPRLTLTPSQNGLVHQVKFLGFMGGAMSLLIEVWNAI